MSTETPRVRALRATLDRITDAWERQREGDDSPLAYELARIAYAAKLDYDQAAR